ncbi:hypothetical protein ACFYO0_12505 [Streptomyces sp. NPDC006365]|uniref:hypothetical protein n=1 Tax=Streptomyces sp. NPDC006365 TaxID=3364744 RepID=UPI0036CEE630
MAALVLAAAVITWLAVWIGGDAQKLVAGQSATMRRVTRCAAGGGQALPTVQLWRSRVFADGRTGVGDITTGRSGVSVGDTVFTTHPWSRPYARSRPRRR